MTRAHSGSMASIGKWHVTGGVDGKRLTVSRSVRINGKRISQRMSIESLRELSPNLVANEIRDQLDKALPYTSSPASYEKFLSRLLEIYPSKKTALNRYHSFVKHTFNLAGTDPRLWHKLEASWGEYLLSTGLKADSIVRIISIANHFLRFSGGKQMVPLSLPKLKVLRSYDDAVIGQYINNDLFNNLIANSARRIKEAILVMRYYGLRRSEVLALDLSAVRAGFLLVSASRSSISTLAPTKSRKSRRVPHWFCEPSTLYQLVSNITLMHPDTLGHEWRELNLKLGMNYELRDLRRSFITDALEKYSPRDVQLAAGHASINTTMKYLVDPRQLDEAIYTPNSTV